MKDKEQFKHSILGKKERYLADRKLKYKKRLLIMAPIVTCLIVCIAVLVFPLMDIPFHPIKIAGDFSQNIKPEPENIKSVNLMKSISPSKVTGRNISSKFISSTANFSVDLFQKTVSQDENCLVSPLSVMLALSMTANGADGNTLKQMEQVLGGNLSIGDLNQYFGLYIGTLPNSDKAKLSIANSIWFRNGLPVNKNFLQTNANYYGASAYQSAFDSQTVSDINNWVSTKTDGMIDSILDENEIDRNTMMYLINTITFDAEWQEIYKSDHISDGIFTAADGTEQTVKYMGSSENLYLDDGKATGFIKPYAGGNYSFVALLPNKNVSIGDYISSLSGDGFIKTVENAKTVDNTQEMGVEAKLPIFSYSYDIQLKDSLQALGMPDAFSELANFHKITEDETDLYISRVIHKTFISVDTKGTKAGAATAVEQQKLSIEFFEKTVFLNRPFVYAIIDNSTNIPIFMGTVMNFPK